eukprot:365359-Chlamydomonas_euryale.AAC.12
MALLLLLQPLLLLLLLLLILQQLLLNMCTFIVAAVAKYLDGALGVAALRLHHPVDRMWTTQRTPKDPVDPSSHACAGM